MSMVQKIKHHLSSLLSSFIREHSKLLFIITVTLTVLALILIYKNPPSQNMDYTPIQYLPSNICYWQGQRTATEILFKNNQYNSTNFIDARNNFKLHFLSYQRRNEKHDIIHYPEDCFRALGIHNFNNELVPIEINNKFVQFKKITAEHGPDIIIQYYIIFTKRGQNFFYNNGASDIKKLLARKFNFKRSEDQLFRVVAIIDKKDTAQLDIADNEIIFFIKSIPLEFWPNQ